MLHARVLFDDARLRNQHNIPAWGDLVFQMSRSFPQQSAGAVALHRITERL
jgi:hypothetical protein